MNLLAHAFLAADTPESVVGNLMADHVKGSVSGYREPIARAMMMHRKIDSFVDAHPASVQSARLFSATYRRYAGIMLDIVHDHFLASSWLEFASIELTRFTGSVYGRLIAHQADLPERMQLWLPSMVERDWLGASALTPSIDRTLKSIGRRLRHANPLDTASEEVLRNLEALESNFRLLLPDTVAFARTCDPAAAPYFVVSLSTWLPASSGPDREDA